MASFASNSTTIVWTNWTATDSTAATWEGWVSNTVTFDNVTVSVTPVLEAAERNERERLKREKAKLLLQGALTDAQLDELRDRGYFHVETRRGERRYRLSPNSAPLRVLGEDKRQWSYCIHPAYGYPPEDVVLAQKLLLESDEEAFLRIANASSTRVAA